jgi:hypothetical protein
LRQWCRGEILDEYIRLFDQITQHSFARCMAQIHPQALLAAVVLHPVGALPTHDRCHTAALVATWRFNFDDLGTHPCEHQADSRASLVTPCINDPDIP